MKCFLQFEKGLIFGEQILLISYKWINKIPPVLFFNYNIKLKK